MQVQVEVCFEVKAPPRGESGRAITALEGVGVDTGAHELPMAAGQQVSRPYIEGGHQAPVASMPGAAGQPHTTIVGGGHFLQEGKGEELAHVIVDWLSA